MTTPSDPIDIVVVDGPNLFNRVADVLTPLGNDVGDYLRDWFDFDRMISAALPRDAPWPPRSGVSLVRSPKGLGRSKTRIEDVDAFWARQASAIGCRDVNVRLTGTEREVSCQECGHLVEPPGEKGVDAMVITTLFERMASWNRALLAASDSDYSPVIESLHRLGKPISVLGRFAGPKAALVRQSHEFVQLPEQWLATDVEAYRWFRPGGELSMLAGATTPISPMTVTYPNRQTHMLTMRFQPGRARAVHSKVAFAVKSGPSWLTAPKNNEGHIGLSSSLSREVIVGVKRYGWTP